MTEMESFIQFCVLSVFLGILSLVFPSLWRHYQIVMISPGGGDGRLGRLDCLSIGLVTLVLTSALTSILDVGSALSFVIPVLSFGFTMLRIRASESVSFPKVK